MLASARTYRSWIVQLSLFALSAGGLGVALAEEALKASRPYRDGPLTKADFTAQRPRDATTSAWSVFEYQWKYDYRYELKNGIYTVRLTELDIWADFRRDKSWNHRPHDPLLLDHEQGHFDLAQSAALSALAKLSPRDPKNAGIVAKDAKLDEALRKLETALTTAMQPFTEQAKQSHIGYDKETNSGMRIDAQALARKSQRARLQELIDEVQRLPKK